MSTLLCQQLRSLVDQHGADTLLRIVRAIAAVDAARTASKLAPSYVRTDDDGNPIWDNANRAKGALPYPFCRHPDDCRGRGYCRHDPACND
jgi:hypothetical protein